MELYKIEDKFVVGVKGGAFEGTVVEPQAIMLNSTLVPLKMWTAFSYENLKGNVNEVWEYDYTFHKFRSAEIEFYTFLLEYRRVNPSYISGVFEIFVTEEFVNEKLSKLKSYLNVESYFWLSSSCAWIKGEEMIHRVH